MITRKVKVIKSNWWSIPQEVFIKILLNLETKDILSLASVCNRYNEMCKDDYIWRKLFHRDFMVDTLVELRPGASSWKAEYKRLTFNIPVVLTEVLEQHSHQVLHVSFSHDGKMFATCSKDSSVILWNSEHPCSVKGVQHMEKYSWKSTHFSQFNKTDTLLLVSGVLFGSSMGEIAVFSIDESSLSLRCRMANRPYDIFGTWFSDQYLLSGDLHWLAHLISRSVIWLNKANQEISSENKPIMTELYKFYNRNASSIRAIMIANCPWLNDMNDPLKIEHLNFEGDNIDIEAICNELRNGSFTADSRVQRIYELLEDKDNARNDIILDLLLNFSELDLENFRKCFRTTNKRDIDPLSENLCNYRKKYFENNLYQFDENGQEKNHSKENNNEEWKSHDAYDDLENSLSKYLIFFTGSKTYLPHEIGFKRIQNIHFPTKLDPGPSLRERYVAKQREKEERAREQNDPREEPNWRDYDSVADRFDKIDKIIDLHGHIIGMALSPDHRFLYVNTRPWPKNYVITNPLEPPPIAQEIEIHVIDMTTLESIGNIFRAHKAYTPNTECFFIFLNVCDDYVASGAEDKHAYIWDRFYGHCLAKYKHQDVVNGVAFNPKDSEMLITTSDDYSIKVWRSKEKAKQLNIPSTEQAMVYRKKNF
ncbi:F-box/WD repeat-containing protein 5-like [Condylostylus longicornis]|uniref:F-box/WD repeat-containing protein 5-like n=1 Tax=Condylostylus longicornis TaxID=2530218 RepID=UPI00244E18D6|nr:F-box/WD repeat-containing protein 5-like [Condylostylus longicornis]